MIIELHAKHRFVPLKELVALQSKYRELPDACYKGLAKGNLVMLYAEAVGMPKKCPEEVWVIIGSRSKDGRSFKGIVNTNTVRDCWHGLQKDSAVEFLKEHIVNVIMKVKQHA